MSHSNPRRAPFFTPRAALESRAAMELCKASWGLVGQGL